MSVALNTKHLSSFISEEEYAAIYPQVEAAHKQLEAKNGPGSDFLGWMTLPRDYDKEEFARIKAAAAKIREDSDVLVVAGICLESRSSLSSSATVAPPLSLTRLDPAGKLCTGIHLPESVPVAPGRTLFSFLRGNHRLHPGHYCSRKAGKSGNMPFSSLLSNCCGLGRFHCGNLFVQPFRIAGNS